MEQAATCSSCVISLTSLLATAAAGAASATATSASRLVLVLLVDGKLDRVCRGLRAQVVHAGFQA